MDLLSSLINEVDSFAKQMRLKNQTKSAYFELIKFGPPPANVDSCDKSAQTKYCTDSPIYNSQW